MRRQTSGINFQMRTTRFRALYFLSNLRDADIESALQKLGRPPALWVEVGSFHGHSAVLTAQMLDKKGFKDTPLVCVDPWTGDLGMLLFRDDWQKKLTPGEISEG